MTCSFAAVVRPNAGRTLLSRPNARIGRSGRRNGQPEHLLPDHRVLSVCDGHLRTVRSHPSTGICLPHSRILVLLGHSDHVHAVDDLFDLQFARRLLGHPRSQADGNRKDGGGGEKGAEATRRGSQEEEAERASVEFRRQGRRRAGRLESAPRRLLQLRVLPASSARGREGDGTQTGAGRDRQVGENDGREIRRDGRRAQVVN
jgi:hypothetical protein